jgi:glycine/D-amino acid oxidase-like deaminating enzyme/nitrite reductase/ring-hydroxylating ferredoxin subunit
MRGSLWTATSVATTYEPLPHDVEADVCVIGGGITGLTAALVLKQAGRTVALVEMDRIASGVTAYTTGKVTALHGLVYDELRSHFGTEGAQAYAEANLAGLAFIDRQVRTRGIDCDFRRKPAITWAEHRGDDEEAVRREADAARDAGLAATFTTDTGLPWPVAGAVRLEDQAELHARRYLIGLASAVPGDGSAAYERTRALAVEDGTPCRVKTDRGTVTAADVVVATHVPMLDRGLFFARLAPERSYVVALRAAGELPEGMYLSAGSPSHSLRLAPLGGEELLLVGGEGHKTGQGGDTGERYARLEAWARTRFDVREVVYRWSAQDSMPADGMPYVGRLSPVSHHVWTAAGYRKWGLSNGTAAALILADAIRGRESPWAATFDANRFKPLAAAATLLKENVNVGAHFFGDRLAPPALRSVDALAPGDGGIVMAGGDKAAAYRAEDGTLHVVSHLCTHLFCQLSWNGAERSWDCPCHGSRFDVDGRVLEGPAVSDLEPKALDS